jgi:HPt (histidine-containing phosphotransfer) domain-containing protein
LGDELRRDSPRPAADQSPVDLSVALRQAGGSASLLIELVGIFQDDLPGRVARLQTAVQAADPDDIGYVAHAIRGSLAGLGARTAAALASELEALARDGRLEQAPATFGRLARELDRLTAFLADPRWRERLSGS